MRQTAAITITGANDRPEVRAPVMAAGRDVSGSTCSNASDVDHGGLRDRRVRTPTPEAGAGRLHGSMRTARSRFMRTTSLQLTSLKVRPRRSTSPMTLSLDEHARSVRQTAAVMITGTNDAPEVVVNSPATVNEGDAGVSAPIGHHLGPRNDLRTGSADAPAAMRAGSPSSAPPVLRRRRRRRFTLILRRA